MLPHFYNPFTKRRLAMPSNLFRLACQQGIHSGWILARLITAGRGYMALQELTTRTLLIKWASVQFDAESGRLGYWVQDCVAAAENLDEPPGPRDLFLSVEGYRREDDEWVRYFESRRNTMILHGAGLASTEGASLGTHDTDEESSD